MFTYYDVLGVSPNANTLQIKRAYRNRVKQVHPDVVHSDQALRKVKVLNRAYAVLRDKQRRAEYDESVIATTGHYVCSTTATPSSSYKWAWLAMIWLIAAAIVWAFTHSSQFIQWTQLLPTTYLSNISL